MPTTVRPTGPASTGTAVRPTSARRLHLVVSVAGTAFGLTPLTAVYAVHFGASPLPAGLAFSSLSLVVLLLDILAIGLVPRLEPGRAQGVALLGFSAGSLGSAPAPGFGAMIAARVGQGIGAAPFTAVGPQLAVRSCATGSAGRALGRFNAAWFLGIAIGPLLGGALAESATSAPARRAPTCAPTTAAGHSLQTAGPADRRTRPPRHPVHRRKCHDRTVRIRHRRALRQDRGRAGPHVRVRAVRRGGGHP